MTLLLQKVNLLQPLTPQAEQVRDELLTKLNTIEVQIENFSINPRPKQNDIEN
jgi:hypothetical protein